MGLHMPPPRFVAHTAGHQQRAMRSPGCREDCGFAPSFTEERDSTTTSVRVLAEVCGGHYGALGRSQRTLSGLGGGGQVTEEVTSEKGFEEVLQLRTQEKKNH